MSNTDVMHTANDFLDAFNTGDWARFRARLAPDVAYEETGTGRSTQDADTYVTLCQGWKDAFPDAAGTIRHAVASGDVVVQELTWVGTQTGPLPTPAGILPASGRHIAVAAILWFTFRDGRATNIHHHLDVLTMLQQLGAIPTADAAAV